MCVIKKHQPPVLVDDSKIADLKLKPRNQADLDEWVCVFSDPNEFSLKHSTGKPKCESHVTKRGGPVELQSFYCSRLEIFICIPCTLSLEAGLK